LKSKLDAKSETVDKLSKKYKDDLKKVQGIFNIRGRKIRRRRRVNVNDKL